MVVVVGSCKRSTHQVDMMRTCRSSSSSSRSSILVGVGRGAAEAVVDVMVVVVVVVVRAVMFQNSASMFAVQRLFSSWGVKNTPGWVSLASRNGV